MMESSWDAGNDVINFNLPGVAPVTIQLTSKLPNVGSPSWSVTIDGYSQPGSAPNTATTGDNAIQGVEIRGVPTVADIGFYIARPGNTIRGMIIDNVSRGIVIDGPNAIGNRILGNWIGFTPAGAELDQGHLRNPASTTAATTSRALATT